MNFLPSKKLAKFPEKKVKLDKKIMKFQIFKLSKTIISVNFLTVFISKKPSSRPHSHRWRASVFWSLNRCNSSSMLRQIWKADDLTSYATLVRFRMTPNIFSQFLTLKRRSHLGALKCRCGQSTFLKLIRRPHAESAVPRPVRNLLNF